MSDDPPPTRPVEVDRLAWVDGMFAELDGIEAQLLAYYTLKFGGRLHHPDRWYVYVFNIEFKPLPIDALSRWCPCREEHASTISEYYETIDEAIMDAVRGVQTETTQFIQKDFLWLATQIANQQNKDDPINKFRGIIFDQLEGPREESNILQCLLSLIKNRICLREFANLFVARTLLSIIEKLHQRLRQAADRENSNGYNDF
ncbi:hypothetical protein BDW66DRAFT_154980 [Aspergillus desertorum]